MRNHSLALDVSLATVEKLAVMQEELNPWLEHRGAGASWNDASSMRIGLISLDDLDDVMLMSVSDAVTRVTDSLVPFKVSLRGLKCLPEDNPRIILAEVAMGRELVEGLRKVVSVHLEKLGVAPDDRPAIPSVFVGRLSGTTRQPVAADLGAYEFGDSQVRSIVLLRQELTPRGATTEVLRRFALGPAPAS